MHGHGDCSEVDPILTVTYNDDKAVKSFHLLLVTRVCFFGQRVLRRLSSMAPYGIASLEDALHTALDYLAMVSCEKITAVCMLGRRLKLSFLSVILDILGC